MIGGILTLGLGFSPSLVITIGLSAESGFEPASISYLDSYSMVAFASAFTPSAYADHFSPGFTASSVVQA